jgi:predicted transcriptional regulator
MQNSDKEEKKVHIEKKNLIPPSNTILSSSIRLGIMLIVYFYGKVTFVELKQTLNCPAGSLDYHLNILKNNNYVIAQKVITRKRPITLVKITPEGEKILKEYSSQLREILKKIE